MSQKYVWNIYIYIYIYLYVYDVYNIYLFMSQNLTRWIVYIFVPPECSEEDFRHGNIFCGQLFFVGINHSSVNIFVT